MFPTTRGLACLLLAAVLLAAVLACTPEPEYPVATLVNEDYLHRYANCFSNGIDRHTWGSSTNDVGPVDIDCAPVRDEELTRQVRQVFVNREHCQIAMGDFFWEYDYADDLSPHIRSSIRHFADRICNNRIYFNNRSSYVPANSYNYGEGDADGEFGVSAGGHVGPGSGGAVIMPRGVVPGFTFD